MRKFHMAAGILFLLVAVMHLLRLLMGWSVRIEGFGVPLWWSIVGVLVAGCMSVWSFRLEEQPKG